MKKERKLNAFTLVELLVVIAILAVLATVSVVGYTSFINKANDSNALTECKQLEEVILSDLVSFSTNANSKEDHTCNGIWFDYDEMTGKIVFKDGEGTKPAAGKEIDELKEKFDDAKNLSGKLYYIDDETLVYRTENGKGYATWKSTKTPEAGATDPAKKSIGEIEVKPGSSEETE